MPPHANRQNPRLRSIDVLSVVKSGQPTRAGAAQSRQRSSDFALPSRQFKDAKNAKDAKQSWHP
jgi:hypothetical protein